MIKSRIQFVAAVVLSVGTMMVSLSPSYAQDDMRKRGDRACGGDARRVCRSVQGQGDMAMLGCFQANKRRLSRSCAKFLTDIGQLH